ncbi:hypothetical protein [Salibacterium halotolerans]|uniref:DUF4901 domain-containing protein n=1 Tax=Salibacterium halotolerans TaxID=1884432 RepID=A0A1I5XNY3_9BACI|nr:hypothetical protein [Salibacterium halotolerans]SFQ33659.1 hypothetical protein SAMN05518683_1304 [Salibacterium halotolerans]
MDERIKSLIEYTKTTLGLARYHLLTHDILRSVNVFHETIYTLSMEWLPPHMTERGEEGLNPAGTAVVNINIHTHHFQSIIFVRGETYADKCRFGYTDSENIITWLEKETGLAHKKQFQLIKDGEGGYRFEECIDGVKVSPSGCIDIHFNDQGRLTFFSIDGQFPPEDMIHKEPFALTRDNAEPYVWKQLQLLEFPSRASGKILPVYVLDELYVTNDGASALPFEIFAEKKAYQLVNQRLTWQTPLEGSFEGGSIELQEDVSAAQAFACEPHPDTFPITVDEQQQVLEAVVTLMRQEYPQDSGKWVLHTINREKGYLLTILKPSNPDRWVFAGKIKVFLHPDSLQVVNYIDNKLLRDMYSHYEKPEKTTIRKEEAYEKIKQHITVTPVYIYDEQQRRYVLCGKLDCDYGVHAADGSVFLLDDL